MFRGEHTAMLASLSNLGSVPERQGKYEEAEAMHRRALEGYEKVPLPPPLHTIPGRSVRQNVHGQQ